MVALTIGKLARVAGVGVETVRFYERRGLIARPLRPERGFRHYSSAAVHRIKFIRQAQELGFSLAEIDQLLALRTDPESDCSAVKARATAKLDDVRGKIDRLRQIEGALEQVIAACPGRGGLGECSIIEAMETYGAD